MSFVLFYRCVDVLSRFVPFRPVLSRFRHVFVTLCRTRFNTGSSARAQPPPYPHATPAAPTRSGLPGGCAFGVRNVVSEGGRPTSSEKVRRRRRRVCGFALNLAVAHTPSSTPPLPLTPSLFHRQALYDPSDSSDGRVPGCSRSPTAGERIVGVFANLIVGVFAYLSILVSYIIRLPPPFLPNPNPNPSLPEVEQEVSGGGDEPVTVHTEMSGVPKLTMYACPKPSKVIATGCKKPLPE